MSEFLVNLALLIGRPALMWLLLLSLIPVMIWLERKGSAYIQDRIGPNRAHVLGFRLAGMVHNLADTIKLLSKEDLVPSHVNRPYYLAAPFVAMTVALLTYAVIPFADTVVLGEGRALPMQAAPLGVGLLYVFAVSSLAVYALVLAGWGSNNKYSLLGGVRASAQMFSYELGLGLSVAGIILVFGTVELNRIVQGQGELWGFLPKWGILVQPLGFVIYLTCAFAETNRNPFDLPEGESEIVAGYHVEYSSMKFALFFMAEYVNILIQAALITTLFLGGWQIPWVPTETLKSWIHVVLPALCGGAALGLLALGVLCYRYHLTNRWVWSDRRRAEGLYLTLGCLAAALVLAALCATGIWHPVQHPALRAAFTAALQFGVFVTKLILVAWVFIWVRWTLPRFRYDQLMRLGWQALLPLALVNLVVTAGCLLFLD